MRYDFWFCCVELVVFVCGAISWQFKPTQNSEIYILDWNEKNECATHYLKVYLHLVLGSACAPLYRLFVNSGIRLQKTRPLWQLLLTRFWLFRSCLDTKLVLFLPSGLDTTANWENVSKSIKIRTLLLTQRHLNCFLFSNSVIGIDKTWYSNLRTFFCLLPGTKSFMVPS